MSRWTRTIALLLIPALVMGVTLLGCSGDKPAKGKKDRRQPKDDDGDGDENPTMTSVKTTGKTGTIKGVVKFEGAEPDTGTMTADLREQMKKVTQSLDVCLTNAPENQKEQQTWRINPETKGVENVVVFIKPVGDHEFFDVSKFVNEKKGFPLEVYVDQPHCAFIPHVRTIFPRYNNPSKPVDRYTDSSPKTGQIFKVKNSSPIEHNTKLDPGSNRVIPRGESLVITDIMPNYKAPVNLSCSIHPWMKGYVWAFDHPYAAVTDAKGNYEIKDVPAGIKVRILAWHESAGWLNSGGSKGQEFEAKEGDNTQNFTLRK
jgi:hypothetical protein